jgi:thioredoxin 1
MGNAAEFSDANFNKEVLESELPVVVDFSATWCGPCHRLTPIIEELAKDYAGKVKVGKVDIDQNQETAGAYDIMNVPTVLFFKGGKRVDSVLGLNAKSVYKSKIDALVSP